LLVAALTVVIAVASLLGGSTYQWCIPLAQVMEHCCCADHDAAASDVPSVERLCCETRDVDSLPTASTTRDDVRAAAPPAALLPTAFGAPPAPRERGGRHQPHVRRELPVARPPPSKQRKLALIQVYRC